MSRWRNVCFTVNNPTDAAIAWPSNVHYGVYQLERGNNGTRHWQGYAEFSTPMRLEALKRWLPTAHFEGRRGTKQQARDYCMKEDTRIEGPWEHGDNNWAEQGKRNDIIDMRDAIAAGATREEINEQHTLASARAMRLRDELLNDAKKARQLKVDIVTLRPWQVDIVCTIYSPVDTRSVYWYYDPVGNTGKTHLATYLVDQFDAFYTNGGKGVDICYAYEGQRVVIFDYVRDAETFVNYAVIEQIKNGILFSSKYASMMKRFDHPHVFIFANFFPARDKMSRDRWRIFEILNDMTALYHV